MADWNSSQDLLSEPGGAGYYRYKFHSVANAIRCICVVETFFYVNI